MEELGRDDFHVLSIIVWPHFDQIVFNNTNENLPTTMKRNLTYPTQENKENMGIGITG